MERAGFGRWTRVGIADLPLTAGGPLPSYSAFQLSAFLPAADLYCPSVVSTQVYSAEEPGSQWPFSSCQCPLLVPSSPLSVVPWTFVLHGQAASICVHLAQPHGFFIWTESFVIFPEDGGSLLIPTPPSSGTEQCLLIFPVSE